MENEVIVVNPSGGVNRYPVTQEQIDDILSNELKDYDFPVKPIYNPRIRDNGRTIAEMYKWGQLKSIKAIEIGKQDSPKRDFLMDTLLHEYYEAYILQQQYMEDFYDKLSKASDEKRHQWIQEQIETFFESLEEVQ